MNLLSASAYPGKALAFILIRIGKNWNEEPVPLLSLHEGLGKTRGGKPVPGWTTERDAIVAAGKDAAQRLHRSKHRSFMDWLAVGMAIDRLRDKARGAAGRPNNGRGYVTRLNRKMQEAGFDWIDAKERSMLKRITGTPDIVAWYLALPAGRRARLNNPSSVVKAYERDKLD